MAWKGTLGPPYTLNHHHLKFTFLGVPGGDPNSSFLTSLSQPPLAFSLQCRHHRLASPCPEGPIMSLRTLPGSRFYQSRLLQLQDAPYNSSFSGTRALPDAWGFLPRPASLWPERSESSVCKRVWGQPYPSPLAWFSVLGPIPDLPPLSVPLLPIPDTSPSGS